MCLDQLNHYTVFHNQNNCKNSGNSCFCKNRWIRQDKERKFHSKWFLSVLLLRLRQEYYCKNDLRIGWILGFLWKYSFVEYRRLLLFTFASSHSNFLKPPFFLHSQSSYWHFHLGPEQLCSQSLPILDTESYQLSTNGIESINWSIKHFLGLGMCNKTRLDK